MLLAPISNQADPGLEKFETHCFSEDYLQYIVVWYGICIY